MAWLSERLYRVTADFGPDGQEVVVDGWDDALDIAWRQLVDTQSEVLKWVDDYWVACGDEGLCVTFGDTSRVVGRRGYGDFNVSYPTDLPLAGDDQVSAMGAAILVVLDRHVDRRNLGLPLLSALVGAH